MGAVTDESRARTDPLPEPERVAVRLSRWLAILTTLPAGLLSAIQGWRDGSATVWLAAMIVVIVAITVLLLVIPRSAPRAQAAALCVGLTGVGWLALLHFGPILGVGAIIAASCACTTFFFGRAGMSGIVAATLGFLALAAWANLSGHWLLPRAAPRTFDVWLRTWFSMAGSIVFLCGTLHVLQRRYRTLLGDAIEREHRIDEQRGALARMLEAETEARRTAEEAIRARDEFLTLASHELRTPLTALKLTVQALGGRERATPQLESADRQIQRLERLIGSLLDVTRLDAGRIQLARETVDLAEVARDAIAGFDIDLRRTGSVVSLRAPSPVRGLWDPMLLGHVLTHLVGNAVKFGQGRPIDVEVEGADDEARVVVRDHGGGISPEVRAHLFERYHRGVSWTHYGGLGLGLYLAREIAELHGGRLGVESEPGRGTAFTLALPRAA